MRKLAIGLALASTVLATPALARDGSFYAGVEGGLMIIEDDALLIDDEGNELTAGILNFDMGYDVAAIAGYDAGFIRLEGELGYKSASVEEFAVLDTGVRIDGGEANANALSLMVNALADFGDGSGWSGFVGPGIGVARVSYGLNENLQGNIREGEDFTDTGFAWQIVAGVRKAITPMVDVGLKYRYFNVLNLQDDLGGDAAEADWRSHSLLLSLVYNFAPPPPPPVLVAPPPPPAPATQTCPDGTVILAADTCPAPPPPPVPNTGERG